MYCKNLRIRKKNYKPYFYCLEFRQVLTLISCEKCLKRNLVRNKGIKKVSKNKISVKKEIYKKVYERDKGLCRLQDITCNGGLELHHIIYRLENKSLINEPSNCIMLCNAHHRLVHSNKHYWQPILKEMIKSDIKI